MADSGFFGSLVQTTRALRCHLRLPLGRPPKVRMLYLEVTHRCNARCVACYTKAGREKPDVLTFDEKKDVIRQAGDLGARVVSLSGSGEPLLYERLFELIDYIRHLGMQVVVFTNGILLDEKAAERLIAAGAFTYFKLYSLDPTVFDQMLGREDSYTWVPWTCRNDGAGREVMIPSGLKFLLEAQGQAEAKDLVRIETLITRQNRSTLGPVAQLCKDLGLVLHLETPVFTGRAIENYEEVALRPEEYATLYDELLRILGSQYFDELRAHPCPVERNPVVWTNGDVGFCSSRPARIGNVRNASLESLFRKARRAKRKEDRRLALDREAGRYFRGCPARRFYERRHGLPCDY